MFCDSTNGYTGQPTRTTGQFQCSDDGVANAFGDGLSYGGCTRWIGDVDKPWLSYQDVIEYIPSAGSVHGPQIGQAVYPAHDNNVCNALNTGENTIEEYLAGRGNQFDPNGPTAQLCFVRSPDRWYKNIEVCHDEG